jgi:hypothetical protein
MKDIFLVSDYISPHNPLENGLNFGYFQSYIETDFDKGQGTIQKLQDKYYDPVAVWHGEGAIEYAIAGKVCTYDVFSKKHQTDGLYLYVISPFGGGSCTFGLHDSLHMHRSFFFFIPEKTKYLIKNLENFYLFINYSNEGTLNTEFFEVIYKDAEEFDIPFDKIIFCISDYNIQESFDTWYNAYIERPYNKDKKISKIKLMYHIWSLRDKAREFKKILNNEQTIFNNFKNACTVVSKEEVTENIIRQKKFLMLNRRMRPHRLYSVLMFNHLNIIDDVFVSYDLNSMEIFDLDERMYKSYHIGEKIPFNIMETEYQKLKKTKPVNVLDFDNLQEVWGFNFEDKRIYLQSYIHITSETNFFENGGYFSEKTWKPIGHLQPFIFMGPAYGLREIKKFGFRTFSPFINESYDDERNDKIRFKMIIDEIERLSKLSLKEIHNWYHSIFQDVLVYNQELFLKYESDKLMKEFFTRNLFEVLNVKT